MADLPVVLLSLLAVHAVSFGVDAQTPWQPSAILRHVISSDLGLVLIYAALISLFRYGHLGLQDINAHPDSCGADILVRAPRARTRMSAPHQQDMQSAFQAVAMATLVLAAGTALSGGGTVTTAMRAGAPFVDAAG